MTSQPINQNKNILCADNIFIVLVLKKTHMYPKLKITCMWMVLHCKVNKTITVTTYMYKQ